MQMFTFYNLYAMLQFHQTLFEECDSSAICDLVRREWEARTGWILDLGFTLLDPAACNLDEALALEKPGAC